MKQKNYSVTFSDFEDDFRYRIFNEDEFSDFMLYGLRIYAFKTETGLDPIKNFNEFFSWLWDNNNSYMQDEWDMWYYSKLEYLDSEFNAIITSVYKDTGYLDYSNYFMLFSNNRHIQEDLIKFDNLHDFMSYLHGNILNNSIDDFEVKFKEDGIKSEITITIGNTSFYLTPYYTSILDSGIINIIIFNYRYSLDELVDCFEMELGAYVESDITRPKLLDILLDELSQKPVITEGFVMNQDYFDNVYDLMIEYLEHKED